VIVLSLAALPLGVLGDLKSRRAVIAFGVGLWSAFTALGATVSRFWQLLVCRSLVGVGEAGYGPAAQALLAEFFQGKPRAFALGVYSVGMAFGGVLGICLYATIFVLPVYLQNLQNFTAEQTGFVILPGALASAFTMATMGRFTGKFDGRFSILAGVLLFALSMWKHAHFTTDSGMSDFFWPLILRGVGLGLIFVPLTNLALADLPMSKIPNGTGLFNLMRQLGGSVGIAISATLVQRFTAIHRADLIANVTQYSEAARERLSAIVAMLIARGTPAPLADAKALAIVNSQVTRQALMLSFEQLFLLFGACFVLSLPLLLLMHKSKAITGGAAAH